MQSEDYITKQYLDEKLSTFKTELKDELKSELKSELTTELTASIMPEVKKMFIEFSGMIISVIEDQNKDNQARFEAVVEQKNDELKINHEMYGEVKDNTTNLGVRVDSLEVRVDRLETV